MKNLLTFTLFFVFHFVGIAQCEEEIYGRNVEIGMFAFGGPIDNTDKQYVAEISSVNGDKFTCRFLHSNSIYEFENLKRNPGTTSGMLATVKSNKGGSYAAGTVFVFGFYMVDPDHCDLSSLTTRQVCYIMACFQDNKCYFGMMLKTDNGYSIQFLHTNNVYNTDLNFKVLSTEGGGYAIGSQMLVIHARHVNFE